MAAEVCQAREASAPHLRRKQRRRASNTGARLGLLSTSPRSALSADNSSRNVSGPEYNRTCDRLTLRPVLARREASMTDPGWDIPGIPRAAPSGGDALGAADGSA